MGYSRKTVSDVREIAKVTLLAVNDFMIPIIRDRFDGTPITESLLKHWNIKEEFLDTAFKVVMGAEPLAKDCYDTSVSLSRLAIE